MDRRLALAPCLLVLLGGCATALIDTTGTERDSGVGRDSSIAPGDASSDGTTGEDVRDGSRPDATTDEDTRADASSDVVAIDSAGDVGSDTRVDSAIDSGVDSRVDGGTIDVGGDGATGCGVTAYKVLFYGPVGTKEQPYVPTGAVVTVADATTWGAMTTAQFAAYNLIVIGEQGSGPGAGGAVWQVAFDTRSTWTAAVSGRIVVTTLDPVAHVGVGTTFVRAAMQWAASGPGTGMYVGPDYGNRKLDFMSGFGTWTALGQNSPDNSFGDDIKISLTSHGTMAGSTESSLSSWSYSYHGSVTTFPSSFVSVASSRSVATRHVVVARDVACP